MKVKLLLILSLMICFLAQAESLDKSIQDLKNSTIQFAQKDQKKQLLENLNTLKKLTTNEDYSKHFKLILHKAYKSKSKSILKHYCEHKDFKPLKKSRICKYDFSLNSILQKGSSKTTSHLYWLLVGIMANYQSST